MKRLIGKGIKVAILDVKQLPASLQGCKEHLSTHPYRRFDVYNGNSPNVDAHVKFFECDITSPSAVYQTAIDVKAHYGAPTILINNAGILKAHTILDTKDDYLKKIFEVNVLSNWYTTKAFLPEMIKANKGHIVTIASTASYIGVGGLGDYNATKAAILSFHESLSQELKHHYNAPNVLTTSIHPNWCRTPLLAPVEDELTQRGSVIIEPQAVADAVVARILGCAGGQIFLPADLSQVTALRGYPNWVQEKIRDGVTKTIYGSAEHKETGMDWSVLR